MRPFLGWLNDLPIADPVRRAEAQLLQGLLLAVLATRALISALDLVAPALVPDSFGGPTGYALMVALVLILAMLRRGWLRPAVFAAIAVAMSAVTVNLFRLGLLNGGVVTVAYVIPIALAGLLLARLSLAVVTGLCIALTLVSASATPPGLAPNSARVLAFAIYVTIIAALLDRYRVAWESNLAAARESEERLRLALDAGEMGTWDWDLRGGQIVWGGNHEQIMGFPPGSFDGRYESFARAVHPDDLPGLNAAVERSRHDLALYAHEYRIVWPDGAVRWAAGRGRVIVGEGGEPARMLGVIADITARKAAQAELAAATAERDALLERLQLVLERAPIGVVMNAPDFTVTYWNPAAERIFGWSAAEIVGRSPYGAFVAEEARPYVEAIQRRLLAGDTSAHGQNENRTKDGRVIFCEWSNTPLFDPSGTLIAFLAMVQDVTERRRREEETRELNAELERRVAERTAELAAKNRELEVFAYSVSHDLKAPLRGIDGYSRLLEEDFAGRLDGDGPYYIAMIRAATAGMGELIDDLLAYSRVERRAPRLRGVDLGRLAGLVVAEQGDTLARAGASVEVALPELTVMAEEEGLALVLRNLLENAIKFTRDAPAPAIAIGGAARGDHCLLWVRDNGIGFAMTYHDRIFELFQRLHRAEDYPGTGIGLAIVRKAVERMGGAVWAESAPGQGATFFLRLPRAPVEEP